MANYSTVRYRDPAISSYPHPRDRPFTHSYSHSHSARPIHIIDSSNSPDDILNNTLTTRVLPALLNRSDRDGRPLKVVINQGNLYMEDSALDNTTSSYPYTSRYGGGTSKDKPNTVIYNAPRSTMAITSPDSGGTGSSILRRPTSPLIRTVSPSDTLLGVAYDSGRLGRRSFYRTRSRSRSRDRYGQHRRISYYDSGPPSPTYSSLSTISSSSTIGAVGHGGSGAGAVIDRRPLAMCLGCFKTQRVCSNGLCSMCDFMPNNTPRGSVGGGGSSYEKEVYIERPDGTSRRTVYESGGHGRHRDRDRGVYYDEFGTRRARGVVGGSGGNGNGRREARGRSRDRELAFEVEEREQESGRDKDRFRAKERAWERMERDHMRGGNGGAGGGPGRKGGRGGNRGPVFYDSDSEF